MGGDSFKHRAAAPAGRYASPPCLASEIDPAYFDPLAVDPEQARDVARWRKAERTRLRDARMRLSVAERELASELLRERLNVFLAEHFGDIGGRVFAGYWPIKGEPDLRPLLADLCARGVRVALPLVERKAAPLVFRRWSPDTKMRRGDWNIPTPPPEAEAVLPDFTLAPLVGWDGAGYRLGYGGGYFDRTLGALSPKPLSIGIGYESARLATIYPQPHDIRLDAILTETGIRFPRGSPDGLGRDFT